VPEPPAVLFHGTATRFPEAILQEGLKLQCRNQVHLSPGVAAAEAVGMQQASQWCSLSTLAMHETGFALPCCMDKQAGNRGWISQGHVAF
jgi:putative RNA 2'-phosphotransferase